MKKSILALGLICSLASLSIRADEKEPSIVFDNHPEVGIPSEATAQMHARRSGKGSSESAKEAKAFDPRKLHEITEGTIKTVRIRYYNKETWKTEDEVREYVQGYLTHKSLDVYGFPIWSQMVGMPEIEYLIDFTDEYRKKLREEDKPCNEGRLIIWNTESCFRDATGQWMFVSAYDHFHAAHPKGKRELAKPGKEE